MDEEDKQLQQFKQAKKKISLLKQDIKKLQESDRAEVADLKKKNEELKGELGDLLN